MGIFNHMHGHCALLFHFPMFILCFSLYPISCNVWQIIWALMICNTVLPNGPHPGCCCFSLDVVQNQDSSDNVFQSSGIAHSVNQPEAFWLLSSRMEQVYSCGIIIGIEEVFLWGLKKDLHRFWDKSNSFHIKLLKTENHDCIKYQLHSYRGEISDGWNSVAPNKKSD